MPVRRGQQECCGLVSQSLCARYELMTAPGSELASERLTRRMNMSSLAPPLPRTRRAIGSVRACCLFCERDIAHPPRISRLRHVEWFSIFNARSQETVDVCLEMLGCLQAERTIAIRKRKFLNKFSVIGLHNALCRVFVAIAKTELESRCTDV